MTVRTRLARALAACVVFAAGLGVASCEPVDPPDARFVSSAGIKTLDPVESGDMYSSGAQHQVYEGLYEYHYLKRPAELQPAIAAAMPEITADGRVYTIRLRDDVVFHDDPCFPDGKGRKVVADDFVYCWKRLMAMPDSQGNWLIEGKVVGLDAWAERAKEKLKTVRDKINEYYPFEHADMRSVIAEEVPGLRAVDDHTLRVELTEPYPQFMWTLAMSYTAVYPREALETYGVEFRLHPVGSGPYLVREYWPFDKKIVFHRFPNYRPSFYPEEGMPGDAERGLLAAAGQRLPLLDRVELIVVENSQPRWLRMVRGDLERVETEKDLWEEVMTAKTGELQQEFVELGIEIEKRPIADVVYTAFNMDDPVLGTPAGEKGKKLRQAISLAYDAERWIDVMRNGFWATPARGPIPPTVAGYVDEFSPYAVRDLARAKQLVREAYPEGTTIPKLTYEMTGSDATNRHGANILKKCLSDIGIEIELVAQTWPQFLEKVKKKQAQMFGMAWSADYPDAQNFLQLFYGPHESPGPNNSNYKNPEYDRLYDQMKVMQPGPERDVVIRKMLKVLYEDCPWSFTDHRVKYSYFHHWLKNYKYNDLEPWAFKYYDVDKAAKEHWKRTGGPK